jgi:fibronectin-binding autotransporter adhesin
MKKNFYSIKKPKWGLIALFMTICCLFANTAIGQVIPSSSTTNDIIVWTGNISSDWNDAGNWYIQSRATTGVAGTSTYPGQVDLDDWAVIPTNGTNPPIITTGQTFQVARVYVTNQFNAAGGTLTINSGGTLNVVNNASITVTLNGGKIINNGALNISSTGAGFTSFPVYGIQCGNPNTLPTVPTEWGYSGSGALSISLPNANFANSAPIVVSGNSGATTTPTDNANVIYRMELNNATFTYNQASAASISAIRGAGGNNANKLIIAGTGVTIGTVGSPYIGSLISLGGGASVTVETGTTLTLNSISTNANSAITGFSSSTFPTNLTNKGTINVLGASSRNGIGFATGASGTASVYNITNEGTLNVNLNCTRIGDSAYAVTNGGGGTANAGSVVNFNNTSTGILTLKNTATAVGTGFPIFCCS